MRGAQHFDGVCGVQYSCYQRVILYMHALSLNSCYHTVNILDISLFNLMITQINSILIRIGNCMAKYSFPFSLTQNHLILKGNNKCLNDSERELQLQSCINSLNFKLQEYSHVLEIPNVPPLWQFSLHCQELNLNVFLNLPYW